MKRDGRGHLFFSIIRYLPGNLSVSAVHLATIVAGKTAVGAGRAFRGHTGATHLLRRRRLALTTLQGIAEFLKTLSRRKDLGAQVVDRLQDGFHRVRADLCGSCFQI